MLRELFVLVLLTLVGFSLQISTEEKFENFQRALEEYGKTNKVTTELEETFKDFQFPGLFRRNYKRNILLCGACQIAIGTIISLNRNGLSGNTIAEFVINLCILLRIETKDVCRGTISAHKDSLLFIIQSDKDVTAKRACAVLLQSQGCKDASAEDWNIEIPDKPTAPQPLRNQSKNSKASTPLRVLQLTDIHYDPDYSIGSNANCGSPLCCQPGTVPKGPEDAAGYWGDYRSCDTPWHVYTESLSHIVAQHPNLDMVYYTGDIVDHKVWETNVERNTKAIVRVLNEFKSSFGNLPVFPILGNHEPHPVNAFSTEGIIGGNISTQWIFDLAAKEWEKWLPADTKQTILIGGYYTVLLPQKNRVIALNSNVCFTYNWWLIYDDKDPYRQLEWLVKVLVEAEKNEEKVHILSHVPSAEDGCWFIWGREYSRIVRRFSDTIVAQFNGHSHKKENMIYFDGDDLNNPINIAFNGGSLTTYEDVNPNYIIYNVDPDSFEVQDYDLWMYDLNEANSNPQKSPQWKKLYSFKQEYGLTNLKPTDMANLAKEIAQDPGLRKKYFENKFRKAKPALDMGCNDKCHLDNLCYMVTNHHHGHTTHCDEIKKLFEEARQGTFV